MKPSPEQTKPVGVRLHRADGTVLDVELVDEGVDDEGMRNWVIANAVYRPGDHITIAVLPAMTGITFQARPGLKATPDRAR
jgi:hypothetical protein